MAESHAEELYRIAHRSTDCSPAEAHAFAVGVVFEQGYKRGEGCGCW